MRDSLYLSLILLVSFLLIQGQNTKEKTAPQKQQVQGALQETAIPEKGPESALLPAENSPATIPRSLFVNPLTTIEISSPFGIRNGRNHEGIDLAAPDGTPILAAASGTVTFSDSCSGYGNLMIIRHADGYETYYAHCSVLYKKAGETTEQGEEICAVGNTGNSTGPHLHFEIRKDGECIDPISYLCP